MALQAQVADSSSAECRDHGKTVDADHIHLQPPCFEHARQGECQYAEDLYQLEKSCVCHDCTAARVPAAHRAWIAANIASQVAGAGRGTSPPGAPNAPIASRMASRT